MGAFHGAEICDLIGLHILYRLSIILDVGTYGLYRDDGLTVINGKSPRTIDNIRKKIISEMKSYGFRTGAAGGLYTRGCCAAVAKVGDAKITKIYIYSDKKKYT